MSKPMELKIIPKTFGVRVVNENGDAELGNWHIADFQWKQHAEMFISMYNAAHGVKP